MAESSGELRRCFTHTSLKLKNYFLRVFNTITGEEEHKQVIIDFTLKCQVQMLLHSMNYFKHACLFTRKLNNITEIQL